METLAKKRLFTFGIGGEKKTRSPFILPTLGATASQEVYAFVHIPGRGSKSTLEDGWGLGDLSLHPVELVDA